MFRHDIVRDIVGYEGIYTIDIFGNVVNRNNNKELKQFKNDRGYLYVTLYKDKSHKNHRVHRLIAETFIPNPQSRPHVNHIDGNKENNVIWNLEWTTPRDNNIHASDLGLIKNSKKVKVIETGKIYNSIGSCARDINGTISDISECLSNRRQTHKGYHFEKIGGTEQ